MSFFETLLTHTFLQNGVVAAFLASIACGVVGSYVVVRGIGYIAGGIAHAVLGGMGVAYFFGYDPLIGALISALLSALLVGWVTLRVKDQEDVSISALWSVGMAIGIIFISKTPGYNIDLMSYLFGNILMVSSNDLYLMAALDISILLIVALGYKQFLAISFDEEFATIRGVRVKFWYFLLLCLVAITVVVLIQVVGLILVIALLTLPAAVAALFQSSIGRIMLTAVCLSLLFSWGGLYLSYEPDLPSGATMTLLAGVGYIIAVTTKKLLGRS